jgi:hypothetical protein
LRGPETEGAGELAAEGLGQVGHRVPVGDALLEEPLAYLSDAVFLETALTGPCGERFVDSVQEVGR